MAGMCAAYAHNNFLVSTDDMGLMVQAAGRGSAHLLRLVGNSRN
jgi:hypothetical protein